MKCKYCKTEISFTTWMSYFGKCFYCNKRLDEPEFTKKLDIMNRQEKESNKYWEKIKQ